MIEAKWKEGMQSLYKGADAQKVANEILALGDDITPNQILETARNKNTELHKCFEWDDSIAAERYRLSQARMIVCHLVIKRPPEEKEKPEIRIFYKTDKASNYKPTTLIMTDKTEYEKLLENAYKELQIFKKKYHSLAELDDIMALIP